MLLTPSGRSWPVTDGHRAVRPTCSSLVFSVRFVGDNRPSITIKDREYERFTTDSTRPVAAGRCENSSTPVHIYSGRTRGCCKTQIQLLRAFNQTRTQYSKPPLSNSEHQKAVNPYRAFKVRMLQRLLWVKTRLQDRYRNLRAVRRRCQGDRMYRRPGRHPKDSRSSRTTGQIQPTAAAPSPGAAPAAFTGSILNSKPTLGSDDARAVARAHS